MAFKSCIQPPRSIVELKSLIASGKVVLPSKLAVLTRAMLERPDSAAFDNARTFARRCGVSPTTAHRLPGMLGFRSFGHLQGFFQEELRRHAASKGLGWTEANRNAARPGRDICGDVPQSPSTCSKRPCS